MASSNTSSSSRSGRRINLAATMRKIFAVTPATSAISMRGFYPASTDCAICVLSPKGHNDTDSWNDEEHTLHNFE
ncbi:hypothetical protein GGI12_002025 [Dipsacomyces acuminosporus]|nr:hypothetical protein GGI12_002025 [Dipsacomyces acuminosporus]